MQQDFLLVRKMKNGDEKAMDVFVRQYYAQVLQYCSYHSADREWAQDLTQETFEHFFRKLADYRYHGKSLNYLYTIARNLCIDWGRKNRELVMESAAEMEDRQKVPLQENEIIRSGQYRGMDETVRLDDKLLIEAALIKAARGTAGGRYPALFSGIEYAGNSRYPADRAAACKVSHQKG